MFERGFLEELEQCSFFVVIYSEVLSLAATGDERMDGGPSGIAGTTGVLGLRSGRRVHGLAKDEAAQEPAYLGVVVIPGGETIGGATDFK